MSIFHQVLISVAQGIPNLTGRITPSGWITSVNNKSNLAIDGCCTKLENTAGKYMFVPGVGAEGTVTSGYWYPYFNASKSNALYGKSSNITPLSRKCKYFIKYKN